jgi:hypothetical protein
MEYVSDVLTKKMDRVRSKLIIIQNNLKASNEAMDVLIAEGGENFYNYVEWLGLADDPNLVVLSSRHHYFYDAEELNSVNTVINIMQLNQIKQTKHFLYSSTHILKQKSHFIGCFVDNEKTNGYVIRKSSSSRNSKKSVEDIENGIVSGNRFLNMLYSMMDSRTYNYLSKSSVSAMLEEQGTKVLNMTELNGITYFHSQKTGTKYN